MKSKLHFFNLTRYIAHIYTLYLNINCSTVLKRASSSGTGIKILISIFTMLSVVAFAEGNNYQFNKIAELNYTQAESSDWQQLVTNPSNKQQHFIINKTGQMYLVEDMNNSHPILDLSVSNHEEPSAIQLTAIALHPDFSLRDQLGYGTFYTAHLEELDKKSSIKRIQEHSSEFTLNFDAVITEWQFSSASYQKVDLKTKREVLRIAVPDTSMTIKQMSFSPYTRSWNDGFGLLYVALNGQEKWQKPLYSGVILRINPAKFGLRSFTVPKSNPYLNDRKIKDEIYLLGGQNIKQFTWPDKNKDDILLSHRYKNKSLLSLTSGRDDWRDNAPKKVLYQSDSIIKDVLTYHGRSLPSLRNRLLLLRQENQRWLIESLNIKPSLNQSESTVNKPQQVWQFTGQQLTDKSEITLSTNRDGEVLLLDKTAGMVFQISQENTDMIMSAAEQTVPTAMQDDSIINSYVLFIVLIIIGIVFYVFKLNRFSAKMVVRKQFAQIELSESQQQIGLYHRHQNRTDTIIDIVDIASCEVKLNDHTISLINQEVGYGFNDEKEQGLRAIFAKEQVDKMVDGKARYISLLLTDIHDKSYTVCLYMRKGSDRITKKTYSVVIEDLINWCWLIAEKINADETEKRKKKPAISSEPTNGSVEQSKEQIPLHSQAAAIRPANYKAVKDLESVEKNSPKQQSAKEQSTIVETHKSEAVAAYPHQSTTIDTELVNALEKLVNLKQQGFLTQDEFTKAKKNLLQSLFDE